MAESDEKKTLIETFLPVKEISEESPKQKLGYGKPRTFEMHYWWTRKPLIAARAAVLGALLPSDFDIKEFKRLLGLEFSKTTGKRAHYYDISDERIEQLKKIYSETWKRDPIILDPFAGGGSIPFESLRLGVDSIANDYNPVSYLILKATLEYPKKYDENFIKDVESALNWILNETKRELEYLYPQHNGKEVAAYLWAWSVKCQECGFDNPLVGQWWLCKKNKKKIYLNYTKPSEHEQDLQLSILEGDTPPEGNCSEGKGRCLSCGALISNDIVKKQILETRRERLLAVVVNERIGKGYELASKQDYEIFDEITRIINDEWDHWIKGGLVPDEDIPEDTRGSLSARLYLPKWRDLLNPRQFILFITLEKNIQRKINELTNNHDLEYVQALATYLSFIFGKHIDRNCRSTTWDRTYEVVSSTLGKRGVGMMWDHLEVNPFSKGSGSLNEAIKNILDGLKYANQKLKKGSNIEISNKSITQLDNCVPLIISDPPYFDDVRYAEFSEFFYSWERRVFSGLNNKPDIPMKEEMSVGGWGRNMEFFSKLFMISSKKMYSLLEENGLLILFFAHSSIDAWDFVINALRKSGFRITATWPIHTESTTNPLAQGHASIMSSIIIVARKRKEEKSGYIEEIHDELQNHLSYRLNEFWEYGLRGADLTVASMGATLDIITQYSEIKSYTGEMTIKDVLELVQDSVTQYVLQRYMKNAGGLDAPTAFYLYTRFSGLEGMPFDTANLIAKSMKIDLKVLEKEHLIESVKSKKTSGIKIQTFKDREDLYRRTIPMSSMINAVHYMMAAFAHGGYDEVQQVLSTIPYGRNEIRDILEAFQSLPPGDPERQVAQQILERMGTHFPKTGQQSLDQY